MKYEMNIKLNLNKNLNRRCCKSPEALRNVYFLNRVARFLLVQ
jgi:hypothetical protein